MRYKGIQWRHVANSCFSPTLVTRRLGVARGTEGQGLFVDDDAWSEVLKR